MDDEEKSRAIFLHHLLHNRPRVLAIDAQGVDENLPHNRTPPLLGGDVVHKSIVALGDCELSAAAGHKWEQRHHQSNCSEQGKSCWGGPAVSRHLQILELTQRNPRVEDVGQVNGLRRVRRNEPTY